MNRLRLDVIGALLISALAMLGPQAVAIPATIGANDSSMPTVEEQLRVLTEKLDLTTTQRPQVRLVLQKLHDATERLIQDQNLSREQCLAKVRPKRQQADRNIRALLNGEQKKKLDQYLAGPHGEMHGGLSGATPPPH
jgi:hypothetical protein